MGISVFVPFFLSLVCSAVSVPFRAYSAPSCQSINQTPYKNHKNKKIMLLSGAQKGKEEEKKKEGCEWFGLTYEYVVYLLILFPAPQSPIVSSLYFVPEMYLDIPSDPRGGREVESGGCLLC